MSQTAFDIRVKFPDTAPFSKKRNVPAGTVASINAGEPTKSVDAAGASPYLGTIAPMVNGDGSTAQRFSGIAKSTSSDTVATAGLLEIILPFPGIVYTAKALVSTNANTQALIDALQGKRVLFALTGAAQVGTFSIDTAQTDAKANTVVIVGGDFTTSIVDFVYAPHGTYLDFAISA